MRCEAGTVSVGVCLHVSLSVRAKTDVTDMGPTEGRAAPAIGGPGGRLPLWAALSEKT